jgi:hypothetical protein
MFTFAVSFQAVAREGACSAVAKIRCQNFTFIRVTALKS